MNEEEKKIEALFREISELKKKVSQNEIWQEKQTLMTTEEDRFKSIFNHLADPVLIMNQYGFIIDVNKKAIDLLGYSRQELLKKSIIDITPTEDFYIFSKNISDLEDESSDKIFECIYIKKDGSRVPVEIKLGMISINHKPVIINSCCDISNRINIEEDIRKSEERLKSTLTSMVDLVFVLDVNLIFTDYYQPENTPVYCIKKSMIIGNSYKDVFPKRVAEKFEAAIETLISTKKPIQFDYYFTKREQFDYTLKKAEHDTWYSAKISIRKNHLGEFDGITMVTRDITKNKIDEEALCNSLLENDCILNSITSILIGVNNESVISHWNDIAEKAFGKQSFEMIGSSLEHLKGYWDWELINKKIEEIKREMKPVHLENVKFILPDNKQRYLNITLSPIISENDKWRGFFLLCDDVTELKMLMDKLSEYQKLDDIGEIAAYVAGKINNHPQAVHDEDQFFLSVSGNLRILLERCKDLFNNGFKYQTKKLNKMLQ